MGNVGKLSVKLMLTVLTNLTPDLYMWTCTIWVTSFVASRKWSGYSEQVFINQLNFRPTSIGKHNSTGHLLPCAIDFKQIPHHTFAMDWDTWHDNWAAPCYFNGASPTGSPLWCNCLQRHLACEGLYSIIHDDVLKWKHFSRYWPFLRGIHRSPVNSSHKDQWRQTLMFSLICVWINGWENNGEAGDLRRYCTHCDVIVMKWAK